MRGWAKSLGGAGEITGERRASTCVLEEGGSRLLGAWAVDRGGGSGRTGVGSMSSPHPRHRELQLLTPALCSPAEGILKDLQDPGPGRVGEPRRT